MPTFCGISSAFGNDCDTKNLANGGLRTNVWIGNRQEIESLSYDGNGYVASINFDAYAGLYRFTGLKNGQSVSDDLSRNDVGIAFNTHTAILTIIDVTPDQKDTILELGNADELVFIVETSNETFELYGWPLGMTLESAPKTSGNVASDSVARVLTFTGEQSQMAKVISGGDYAATLAMIEGYEVA